MRQAGCRCCRSACGERPPAGLQLLPSPLNAVQVGQAHHAHNSPLQPQQRLRHDLVPLVCSGFQRKKGADGTGCNTESGQQRLRHDLVTLVCSSVEGKQTGGQMGLGATKIQGSSAAKAASPKQAWLPAQESQQAPPLSHPVVGFRQVSSQPACLPAASPPISALASPGLTARMYSHMSRTSRRLFMPSTC